MFGRKVGLFTALAVAMMLFGGCGNAGANLSGTRNANNRNGMYSSGGTAYWDGYGINSGRGVIDTNNAYYDTYGKNYAQNGNTNNNGNTLGQDLRNTWDDLTGQTTKTARNTNGNAATAAR